MGSRVIRVRQSTREFYPRKYIFVLDIQAVT